LLTDRPRRDAFGQRTTVTGDVTMGRDPTIGRETTAPSSPQSDVKPRRRARVGTQRVTCP
jgi:hypothetical protein